jgi:Phage tail lysozyme
LGAAAHGDNFRDKSYADGKRKFRRAGRHTTPSQVARVAERAGRAAPAFGLVGVLAAAPQVRDLLVSAPAASAVTTPASARGLSGHDSGRAVTGHVFSDRVQSGTLRQASARAGAYRARHRASGTGDVHHGVQTLGNGPSGGQSGGQSGGGQSGGGQSGGGQSGKKPGGGKSGGGKSGGGRRATFTCTGSGGLLPQHYAKIVHFLTRHGYARLAAAGIAGNIYQESGGNPESGGGLIGWTPLPSGLVSGNVAADLKAQLVALLAFNNGWSQYLPELNAARTASAAADIYMVHFERPGIPASSRREASATAVAQACGM